MNHSSVQSGHKRCFKLVIILICICPSRQRRKKFPFRQLSFSFPLEASEHIKRIISRTTKPVNSYTLIMFLKLEKLVIVFSIQVQLWLCWSYFLSFLLPPRRRKEPNEPWSPKHQATVTFSDSWNEFCEVLCDFVVPHGDPIFVNQFWNLQGASYKHHGR